MPEETRIDHVRDGAVRPEHMPRGIKDELWRACGARLRAVGVDHGLTQGVIAAAADIGRVTISQIELGKRAPRLDIVEKLAVALGISPVWLAFGDQGHLRFRQRYPRPALPPDPPIPELAARPQTSLYLGMAARLKLARLNLGLSLRAVAKAAGISPQGVLLIEAGETIPLISNSEALAVAVDVSPGWLAFGDGEGPDAAE